MITGNAKTDKALEAILAERKKQDEKWGEQRHAPEFWMLIAIEELGEVSQARLQDDRQAYRKELIQTAAVMVAWLECELDFGITVPNGGDDET